MVGHCLHRSALEDLVATIRDRDRAARLGLVHAIDIDRGDDGIARLTDIENLRQPVDEHTTEVTRVHLDRHGLVGVARTPCSHDVQYAEGCLLEATFEGFVPRVDADVGRVVDVLETSHDK